jgi:hypothetical protein
VSVSWGKGGADMLEPVAFRARVAFRRGRDAARPWEPLPPKAVAARGSRWHLALRRARPKTERRGAWQRNAMPPALYPPSLAIAPACGVWARANKLAKNQRKPKSECCSLKLISAFKNTSLSTRACPLAHTSSTTTLAIECRQKIKKQ